MRRRSTFVRACWIIVALLAAAASAACSTAQSGSGVRAEADPVSGGASADLRVGELPGQTLASGECGLALWRRSGGLPLVFFFNSTSGRASMMLDGTERNFRRVEVTSSSSGAPYGEQLFSTGGGEISARITIHEREEIAGGARITRAALRVEDTQGWSVAIGVGGLAACQP